jgi:sulfite reductase alpha subunit-like flavoprotein
LYNQQILTDVYTPLEAETVSPLVTWLHQELEDAAQKDPPALTELITAFSREQKEKIYVQHRLREKSAEVKQMMQDGGYIFVCGATSMGKQAEI